MWEHIYLSSCLHVYLYTYTYIVLVVYGLFSFTSRLTRQYTYVHTYAYIYTYTHLWYSHGRYLYKGDKRTHAAETEPGGGWASERGSGGTYGPLYSTLVAAKSGSICIAVVLVSVFSHYIYICIYIFIYIYIYIYIYIVLRLYSSGSLRHTKNGGIRRAKRRGGTQPSCEYGIYMDTQIIYIYILCAVCVCGVPLRKWADWFFQARGMGKV